MTGQDALAPTQERVMPELTLHDFEEQAASILAASKALRGDGLVMMAKKDDEDDDQDQDDQDPPGDEDEDQDDPDGDEDDQEDEDDSAPATRDDGEPFTRADLKALQESLKNARRAERAAKRAARGKGKAGTDDAEKAAEAKYKPIVVNAAARAAFASAGLVTEKGKEAASLKRVMKMLDMDDIELTEDGEVEGLEEQIDQIKSEMPHLFARKGGRRVEGSDRGGSRGKGEDFADKLVDQLSGGR